MEVVVGLLVFTQILSIFIIYKCFKVINEVRSKMNHLDEVEENLSNNFISLSQQLEEENNEFITYLSEFQNKKQELTKGTEDMVDRKLKLLEDKIHNEFAMYKDKGNMAKMVVEEKPKEVEKKQVQLQGNRDSKEGVSLYKQATLMQQQGLTITEIAKKLNKGTVEIELLLKLRQNNKNKLE